MLRDHNITGKSSAIFIVMLGVLAIAAGPAEATIYMWNGSTGTSWSNIGNWVGSINSPGANDIAQFASSSYTNQPSTDTGGDSAGAIWVNGAGNVTLGGTGTLTLGGTGITVNGNAATGLEVDAGAGSLTINSPITFSIAQQWINNSANPVTINSNINGGGKALTINTAGTGVIVLAGSVGNMNAGNNNFGNVTLSGTATAGTVLFLGEPAAAAGTATTTIPAGGLLNLVSGNTNLPIASNVIVNGGTIQNVSATTSDTVGIGWVANEAGTITLNSGLVNFAGVTVNFSHAGNAKSILNLNGGTYIMSLEPTAGTTGTINFNGGTLKLNASVATFAPAALTLNVGNGGAIFNPNGFSTTITNSLLNSGGTSTGGLTLNAPSGGTVTLSGAGNTFAGPTLLNGGRLALANTGALLDSTFDTSGSGTLSFNSLTSSTFGGLQGTGGTLTLSNTASAAVALSVGQNGANTTFSGMLTGTGSLTKIGSGVLNFASTTSNYTGLTTISGTLGALEYSNTQAMPSTSTVNVATGAVLGAAIGGANQFSYSGSGAGTIAGLLAGQGPNGNTINWSNNAFLGLDVSGLSGGSLAINGATFTSNSGAIGLGSIAGTLVMSGTNTYAGGTKILGGVVDINGPNAIGTGTLTIVGGTFDNTSGSLVTLGNIPQVWGGSFTFGGHNNLNLGTGPVSVTSAPTVTISAGTLEVDGNITSSFPLITSGTGTLLLTGSNSLNAAGNVLTQFSNLTSTGTTSVATGNFVVEAPAVFTVSGGSFNASSTNVGTVIGNNITAQTATMIVSGGTYTQNSAGLYIGQKSAGVLTITAGLVNLNASALNFDFSNAGSNGTLNLNGGQLNATGFSSGSGAPVSQINFNGGVLKLTASSASLASPAADFALNVGNVSAAINLNGFATTISNNLLASGSGGLTVSSASGGTLTLSGAGNAYTGTTQLNGGLVLISGGGVLGNAAPLTMNGGQVDLGTTTQIVGAVNITGAAPSGNTIQNGTLIGTSYAASNTSGNAVVAAILSGTSGFTMSGTGGMLTLTAANNYSGSTSVTGGTLALDYTGANSGSLPNTSGIYVGPGASLGARGPLVSVGTFFPINLLVDSGGALDLRDSAATTLFTVNGNLNLNQGSNIYFELGASGGSADELAVTGPISSSGTTAVSVSLLSGQSIVLGQYTLATDSAGGLNASAFTIGSHPAGFYSYVFTTPSNTSLVLTITGNSTPTTAYWTGSASTALGDAANLWGVGSNISTSNWSFDSAGGTDALQVPGAITDVYLTAASATGGTSGSLTTTMDNSYSVNSLNFAVSSGTITSVAINTAGNTLTIGSGGLTMSNSSLASGTISGSGSITLNSSQNWANNSSLPLAVNVPISALSGATTLTLNGTGSGGMALGAAISNGGGTLSLALGQNGTTTLGGTAANTYSGGTTISAGLVRLLGPSALGNSANALTVNAGTLDLNGTSVTMGALAGVAGTIYNNAGSGVSTLTVGSGGASFGGNIADNGGVSGGTVALVLTGGVNTLSGTNTYSGGTNFSAGTLNINSNLALGSGTLAIGGNTINNTSGNPVVLGNVPQIWSSNFTFGGNNNLNLGTGPVVNTAVRTLNISAGTLEVDGNISSPFQVTTTGNGTLVLGGVSSFSVTAGNAFTLESNLTSTGTTSILGGNLTTFGGTTIAIPSGLFTVSSTVSTSPLAAIGNNNSSSPATLLVSGGTYSQPTGNLGIGQHSPGVLTINSGLVKLGNTLIFTLAAGPSPGTLNLNGGQLDLPTIGLNGVVPTSSEQLNFNGGLLQLTASSANLIASGSANFTLNVGDGGALIDLNGHATTITNSFQATGSGGLTVYSSTAGGQLTLSGVNVYLGNTTINGGIVFPTNNNVFSSGTISVNPGGQLYSTAALNFSNALVLSGTGVDGAALEQGGANSTTYSGPVSLSGNTTIHTDGSAGLIIADDIALNGNTLRINGDGGSSTTLGGNIAADSGSLVANANGLMLTGNNGYTGGTSVIGGSLVLGGPSALGPGALAVNGGILNLDGNSATVTSFSGASGGVVTNSGLNPATLATTQNNNTTFGGVIRDSINQTGLTVAGSGGLTLLGANTYSGTTTIMSGALIAGASNTLSPNSPVYLSGGTLDVTAAVQTIVSLTSIGGDLNLNVNDLLTASSASLLTGGTLNLFGTPASSVILLNFPNAYSGSFSLVTGVPAGYNFVYANDALELLSLVAGPNKWNVNSGGSWNTPGNWSNLAVPSGPGVLAIMGTLPNTAVTVTLDSPQTLGSLTFNNTAGYTLTPGTSGLGNLTLNNTGSLASLITVKAGPNAISSQLTLSNTSTLVSVTGAGSLNISGAILDGSGGSSALTLSSSDGTGRLTLSGTNTFAGGMTVQSGELILSGASSLMAGTSLTIGSGAGPGAIFAPLAVSQPASAALAPVPEPGTLVMLAVAGLAALGIWRRRSRSKA